jgi:FAD/FMN-containing dehydrogenase
VSSQSDESRIQTLRERITGEVLQPGDDGYDKARSTWNALIERRPGAVARCADAADVRAAVRFCRENGLVLAVKSGGHDYAVNSVCEGGLLIDLSPMQAVQVEAAARRARVEPGATWGIFDAEAQKSGLATTGGTCSMAGVAGVTLGGGTGHLARSRGLSLDNLVAAEVVIASGEQVQASEQENPDLFWGIRGGSGNFGVVTSFEFALHEVGPEVLAGQVFHRFDDAGSVLRFYREFMADAPDEVQCYAFFIKVPPVDPFPQALHGRTVLDLIVAHTGSLEDGDKVLRPLREFGNPFLDLVQPQPYTVLQQTFDAGLQAGNRWYSRAHYLKELPDAVIDTVLRYTESLPGVFTGVSFEPMGGAINRVAPGATAFAHRDAAFGLHIFPGWTDRGEDEEIMAWAREFHQAVAPHVTGGVYVNLLGPDEKERVRQAYGVNCERLVEVKNRWDPENLFRMNHNIEPTS